MFLAQTFGKNMFHFSILIQCLIFYLDTWFSYYKGLLIFIFEHIMAQKIYVINNYKTQEQKQGIAGTTHV